MILRPQSVSLQCEPHRPEIVCFPVCNQALEKHLKQKTGSRWNYDTLPGRNITGSVFWQFVSRALNRYMASDPVIPLCLLRTKPEEGTKSHNFIYNYENLETD